MKTRLANMLFDAKSLGGIGTTICMPELSVAVDIGFCTPAALRCDTLILTHGHADHVSGLTTWLGTRRLYGMRPGRIIVPVAMLPVMERFLEVLGQLRDGPTKLRSLALILAMRSNNQGHICDAISSGTQWS